MAELKEIFEMVTNNTEPEPGAWTEQERRQRRASRSRKYVAIAVVAAIIVALGVFAAVTDHNESSQPAAQPTPSIAPWVSPAYGKGQTIFVMGEDGSPVALTHGYLPALSPDRKTIAFLRDPADPHYDGPGDPFVLQVWLIHPDGSGLRKLGQQRRCCLGASADLTWSPDGSSLVLNAIREQRWDVATGELLPSPTG
jgi:hypothetical protein